MLENDSLQTQIEQTEKDTIDVITYLKRQDQEKDKQVKQHTEQIRSKKYLCFRLQSETGVFFGLRFFWCNICIHKLELYFLQLSCKYRIVLSTKVFAVDYPK